MSFAKTVKKELLGNVETSSTIFELSALVKMNGSLTINNSGIAINIKTDNAAIARRIFTLVKQYFNIICRISILKKGNFNRNTYTLILDENVNNILEGLDISFDDSKTFKNSIHLKNKDNRNAYLRGCFLAGGSINNPQTAKYHFEIKDRDYNHAVLIKDLLNSYKLNSKVIERKNCYVVYIKEAEKIVNALAYMGASNALMFYENIRVTRDVKNQTNRIANYEQANYEKSYNAALRQIDDIKLIESTIGLAMLDANLVLLCKYRKAYPEYSLIELADIMSDELDQGFTKSKLNHWFRKLHNQAEIIRKSGKE